jgi:hypothetical protein
LTLTRIPSLKEPLKTQIERIKGNFPTQPLEARFTIVLKSVFETREPAMREALMNAIALVDLHQ